MNRVSRITLALASISGLAALTGCGIGTPAGPAMLTSSATASGHIMGGHQPISGAIVTMYAAGTSAYGSAPTTVSTASQTTDANGMFAISFACTTGQQLYIVSTGGNTGGGAVNSSAVLVAALGECDNFTGPINVDEVTTIGAAYALSGFADTTTAGGASTNIGAPSTNLAGLKHAFLNANNLVDYHYGLARSTTPAGNGKVPAAVINSLANSLSACVNSTGASAAGCSSIFVLPPQTSTASKTPTTTWQVALDWALYPGNNVTNVFGNATAQTNFFTPTVSTTPNDLTVGIGYSLGLGGAAGTTPVINPYDAKADASGNIWLAGAVAAPLSELNSTGSIASPTSGYQYSTLAPAYLDIVAVGTNSVIWVADTKSGGTGNIWGINSTDGSIKSTITLPATITYDSSTSGTAATVPYGLAIDTSNNVWFATDSGNSSATTNYVGEIQNNSGTYSLASSYAGDPFFAASQGSTTIGYNPTQSTVFISDYSSSSPAYLVPGSNLTSMTATGSSYAEGLTFDGSGDTWFSTYGTATPNKGALCKYATGGAAPTCVTVPTATSPTQTQYGINHGRGLVIDGLGHFFTAVATTYPSLVEYAPEAGFLVNSSGNGFQPQDGSGTSQLLASYVGGITIDGTGAIWTVNTHAGYAPVIQVLGPGAPTVAPLAAGTYGTRP